MAKKSKATQGRSPPVPFLSEYTALSFVEVAPEINRGARSVTPRCPHVLRQAGHESPEAEPFNGVPAFAPEDWQAHRQRECFRCGSRWSSPLQILLAAFQHGQTSLGPLRPGASYISHLRHRYRSTDWNWKRRGPGWLPW